MFEVADSLPCANFEFLKPLKLSPQVEVRDQLVEVGRSGQPVGQRNPAITTEISSVGPPFAVAPAVQHTPPSCSATSRKATPSRTTARRSARPLRQRSTARPLRRCSPRPMLISDDERGGMKNLFFACRDSFATVIARRSRVIFFVLHLEICAACAICRERKFANSENYRAKAQRRQCGSEEKFSDA